MKNLMANLFSIVNRIHFRAPKIMKKKTRFYEGLKGVTCNANDRKNKHRLEGGFGLFASVIFSPFFL